MEINQYKLVNWVEGMEVNVSHINQLENFFIEQLSNQEMYRLNSFNYGLLNFPNYTNFFELDVDESITDELEIKIRNCFAITQGGFRIVINEAQFNFSIKNYLSNTQKGSDNSRPSQWDIWLRVNPFERIATGIPDKNENPPRHPDAIESYQLQLLPKDEINKKEFTPNHLIIGRIEYKNDMYTVDNSFIPPCTKINSHKDLIAYYESFRILTNKIEKNSKTIISKIKSREQNSLLAQNLGTLCENSMRYVASIYFSYRNKGKDMSPIELVNYFATWAHVLHISLFCMNKADKEELLNYFYEWGDITPGNLKDLIERTLNVSYEHSDIRKTMIEIEHFLTNFNILWDKMSSLEYIGQHKENIVVSERNYSLETPKIKGSWSILD